MLYNILVPFSQDFTLLNVFRYITFRSAGALIFALLFTIITGPWFLKKLAELKSEMLNYYGEEYFNEIVYYDYALEKIVGFAKFE